MRRLHPSFLSLFCETPANTQVTGIVCGDTSASPTGQTFSGQEIVGTDSIKTVGSRWKVACSSIETRQQGMNSPITLLVWAQLAAFSPSTGTFVHSLPLM